MKPIIRQSPMTDNWYVVTRYREDPKMPGVIVAQTKYDVTDQIVAIQKAERPEPDFLLCGWCGDHITLDELVGHLASEGRAIPDASVSPRVQRYCARYWGSDGTMCSTHNGRFANSSVNECDQRSLPHFLHETLVTTEDPS